MGSPATVATTSTPLASVPAPPGTRYISIPTPIIPTNTPSTMRVPSLLRSIDLNIQRVPLTLSEPLIIHEDACARLQRNRKESPSLESQPDMGRRLLRLPKLLRLRLFLRCGRCAKLRTGLKFRLKHAWKLTTRTTSTKSKSRRGLLDRRHLQDGDDLLRAGAGARNRRDLFDESRVR